MSEPLTQHPLGAPVVLERGIKNANFFNGRVLTARDLQDEQLANRQQHRQLGRAAGAGVVDGMEVQLVVTGSPGVAPVLAVRGGLAINRSGQAIELSVDLVQVALARQVTAPSEAGLFADCEPLQSTPDLVGKGVYLFTIAPASSYRDQAPLVSLNGGGKADGCGDRYAVEGVVFRLFELPLALLAGVSPGAPGELAALLSQSEQGGLTALARLTARSRLRNLLAYTCFGTRALNSFAIDPLAPAGQLYDALDVLRAEGLLTNCEVPLALVVWTSAGVRFVDMWPVRRRLQRDTPLPIWPAGAIDRRLAEGEAMQRQFADHLAWLVGSLSFTQRADARAIDFLRYLPAGGVVPLASPGRPGFSYPDWWEGIPHRDNGPRTDEAAPFLTGVPVIEGAAIAPLLDTALRYPPIDLVGNLPGDADQRTFMWLYQVREHLQTINAGGSGLPQRFMVFASGHLPEFGEARFDRAGWSYSNFV